MAKRRNTRIQKRSDFMYHVNVTSPRILYFDALKILGKLTRAAIVVVVIALIGLAGRQIFDHFVRDNPEFHLTQLELPDGCQISGQRVLEACGIQMDSSIFSIDTDELERKLTAMSEVESAEVFVRFPGTLKINLIEREPVAWVECRALGLVGRDAVRGLLIDKNKMLFSSDPAIFQRYESLPVIKLPAMERKELGPGMQLTHSEGVRAFSLLASGRELKENGVTNLPVIHSVQVRSENSLEASLFDSARIIFGLYDHKRQLKDLATILDRASATGRRLTNANLIPKRNIPVQMVPANE